MTHIQAAVATEPGVVELQQVGRPTATPPGWVTIRPTAVGLCGSDTHYLAGHLSDALAGDAFPRVLGHEIAGVVVEANATGSLHLAPGEAVVVWPLEPCGRCLACRNGKENVCSELTIVGVHRDGGLAEQVSMPANRVFALPDVAPATACFAEPLSVAFHAVRQSGLSEMMKSRRVKLAVFGAGPIGQAVALVAQSLGATVAIVDPQPDRIALAKELGADRGVWGSNDEIVADLIAWADGDGPEIVIDTTGVPAVLAVSAQLVARTGTVVVVGLTGASSPFSSGILVNKEVTVVGSSCASRTDFEAAVAFVRKRTADVSKLISHRISIDDVATAFRIASDPSAGGLKVVVTLDDGV